MRSAAIYMQASLIAAFSLPYSYVGFYLFAALLSGWGVFAQGRDSLSRLRAARDGEDGSDFAPFATVIAPCGDG